MKHKLKLTGFLLILLIQIFVDHKWVSDINKSFNSTLHLFYFYDDEKLKLEVSGEF